MVGLAWASWRRPLVVGAALLLSDGPAMAEEVAIRGSPQLAAIVLETIRAAEAGDRAGFLQRIGRSMEPTFGSPSMAEIDRTDEDCSVRSIDATIELIVSVVWSCRDNTKPNVQRSFVIEGGRHLRLERLGRDSGAIGRSANHPLRAPEHQLVIASE